MTAGAKPRNILIVHCHDLGRTLDCYGRGTGLSPALDRFAGQSALFELAFAAAPQCSPARAALFTGRYPQENGVLGLTHGPFAWDLSDHRLHIANRLKDAGFRTAMIGVHHESLVRPDEELAQQLGFDVVQTGGTAELVAERSVEELRRLAGAPEPFYLQVGFFEPHRSPHATDSDGVMGFLGSQGDRGGEGRLTVPAYLEDDSSTREELEELAGAIGEVDRGVGALLDAVDDLDLARSTVVVFTTDHGLALPRAKLSLYDAGLEVALLIRAPGRPEWKGRRISDLVSHVDILPTLFELAGLAGPACSGQSLVPLVERGERAHEEAYGQLTHHNYYDPKRSIRTDRHKLIVNFSAAPQFMDPTQSWRRRATPRGLVDGSVPTSRPLELYDLLLDPDEFENLADDPALQGVRNDLIERLHAWMIDVGDPLLHGPVDSPRGALATRLLRSAAGRPA